MACATSMPSSVGVPRRSTAMLTSAYTRRRSARFDKIFMPTCLSPITHVSLRYKRPHKMTPQKVIAYGMSSGRAGLDTASRNLTSENIHLPPLLRLLLLLLLPLARAPTSASSSRIAMHVCNPNYISQTIYIYIDVGQDMRHDKMSSC